jgi:hypothetical protein
MSVGISSFHLLNAAFSELRSFRGQNAPKNSPLLCITFTNFKVALTDAATNDLNIGIRGCPALFVFVNCLIHYSDGLLPTMPFVFINYTGRFSVPAAP